MVSSLRIAIADDEPAMLAYFREVLPALGHKVIVASGTGADLIERCAATHPDLIITDIRMPDMDGISAARAAFEDNPVPVILVSAYHDQDTIDRAEENHILAFLIKPVTEGQLDAAIIIALSRFDDIQQLHRETADLRQRLRDRQKIERAKGVIMKRNGLSEPDAFRRLQRLANERNKKLAEIADMILVSEEILGV